MKKTWIMKRILSVCMVRQAISIIPTALTIVTVASVVIRYVSGGDFK